MSSAASRKIVVVRDNDKAEAAEGLMQAYRIRRLPVVDADGCLVCILSMNDLARHASFGHRHGELNADRITRTLAAICGRVAPSGHPPRAPTDPDVPDSGIRLFETRVCYAGLARAGVGSG